MDKYDQYKYYICCPMCDLEKCVKGSAECEAEMWAENMRQEDMRGKTDE